MKSKKRAVVVTTVHKGVFFGYATNTDGDTIKLRDSRLAVYWINDLHGFMGLASHGPRKGCKIGPPCDIELRNITAVLEVSPAAEKAWLEGIWS